MRNRNLMLIKRGRSWIRVFVVLISLVSACSEVQEKEALCKFEERPCIKRLNSHEFILEVRPAPPQAFKELEFILSVKGRKVNSEELLLDLTMPGMFMGKNQVRLKRQGNNIYTGRGVIPRCPSGKTLWQAEVILSDGDTVEFRFHVK